MMTLQLIWYDRVNTGSNQLLRAWHVCVNVCHTRNNATPVTGQSAMLNFFLIFLCVLLCIVRNVSIAYKK